MTDHAELRMVAGEAIGRSESEWYVVRGLSHVRDGEDNFICDTCEDEPILASYIATATPRPSSPCWTISTGSRRRTMRCGERYRPWKPKSTGIYAHLPATS